MIQLGLEQFAFNHKTILRGRRVGLVTHMAAVAPDFTHALDLLRQNGVPITALFGPEHGLDGAGADATAIDDATDARTGLGFQDPRYGMEDIFDTGTQGYFTIKFLF